MLRLFPKRGALVVPVSPAEVDAVLEARELVEGHTIGKVLSRPAAVRDALVADLRRVLQVQERSLADRDEPGFVDADRRFHSIIVGEAHNPILLELYESLRDRQLRMGLGALVRDPGRAAEIVAQHVELVTLIEHGEADAARARLGEHLAGTRASVLGR